MRDDELYRLESEAGIISTLIYYPDYIFYSEYLEPNHFADEANRGLYIAIRKLVENKIDRIDTYNLSQILDQEPSLKRYAGILTNERIDDFISVSSNLVRHTVEEYKMLVSNVLDAAFRRDILAVLRKCCDFCTSDSIADIEQKIYQEIDEVLVGYSSVKDDIPQYKEVIDGYWNEIISRQGDGYTGIPFKFPKLNEYATIEPGELFIFAAEAKQGKSMMLLNCTVDLLKKDKSVLYLDSELNTRLFTARILSHLSNIEYKRITAGNYSEEEAEIIKENIEWLKTKKLTHIYIPTFDQQSIYSAIKKVYHTQGIDVLVVDYFKGSGDGNAFDSYQELGRFVDMIKNQICGDMNICGLGAAQATVNGKVADSAKIGRNASTIALLQDKTPEEIQTDGEECGNKKLRVILNRNGMQHAPGEYIDLVFDGNLVSYEQAPKQHAYQEPF